MMVLMIICTLWKTDYENSCLEQLEPPAGRAPAAPFPTGFYQSFDALELSKKYVQKRKLRANFIKIGISISQGVRGSLVVVLKQV
jgi:hypothetical protein